MFLFQMRSSHMISHKAHLLVTEERYIISTDLATIKIDKLPIYIADVL